MYEPDQSTARRAFGAIVFLMSCLCTASISRSEPNQPDLVVTEITAPTEVSSDESFTVTVTVENQGDGTPPTKYWYSRLYLSADDQLDESDLVLNTVTCLVMLGPGDSCVRGISCSISVPGQAAAGSYYLIVKADYDDRISESNEDNNVLVHSQTVTVSQSDLVVTEITAPTQVSSDQTFTVTATVQNQGDGTLHRKDWFSRVCVSPDDQLDESDLILGLQSGAMLGPGESHVIEFTSCSISVPGQAAAGSYYLIVKADYDDRISESDEDNNVLVHSQTITVGHLGIAPVINQISDDIIATGVPYTGPTPTLATPTDVTWALGEGPSGMTIDPDSGVVSWTNPTKVGGPHTVTISATNPAGEDEEMWLLTVMDAPTILHVSDEATLAGEGYQSPRPSLTKGDPDVTWSLESGPLGMTIDAATGQVTWPNTVARRDPYRITIRASNAVGHDDETWWLTVQSPPVIGSVEDAAILSGTTYECSPSLTQGTEPVTWQLVQGPEGMSIDPNTGAVSWVDAAESPIPHLVTISATNLVGSDQVSWELTVQSVPEIQEIGDASLQEGASYEFVPVLVRGTEPVTWTLVTGPPDIAIDEGTGKVAWPKAVAAAEPYAVTVRASNAVGSDSETWKLFVPASYTATVKTGIEVAPCGTPVPLSGEAIWLDSNEPAPDVAVTIRISVQGTRRIVAAQTDQSGRFDVLWQPLAREAGLYCVCADHPAIPWDTNQAQFVLLGMSAEPGTTRHEVLVGSSATGTVNVRNLGDTVIEDIAATVVSVPPNLEIDITDWPASLEPLRQGTLDYTINATDASVPESTSTIELTGAAGVGTTLEVAVAIRPPVPHVVASPKSLSNGMVRGKWCFVQFEIENCGGTPTAQLDVLIPDASWLSLTTPGVIPQLDPDESASIVLALAPDKALHLGPYRGNIAVSGIETGATIPFQFDCVSEAVGDLKVTATDEFTYFAEGAPMVAAATVTLLNPHTGAEISSYATDPRGVAFFHGLPEAYYRVAVQAQDHGSFETVVLVAPGQVTEIEAFLPRHLVTYKWTVTPVAIEDRYRFSVEAIFETHVPAPVVTVDPILLDLAEMEEETIQVDFTFTNHGLVSAQDFQFVLPNHPRFTFTPLVEEIGDLAPQSSVLIPVIIHDTRFYERTRAVDTVALSDVLPPIPVARPAAHDLSWEVPVSTTAGGSYSGPGPFGLYYLICGGPRTVPVYIIYPGGGTGGLPWVFGFDEWDVPGGGGLHLRIDPPTVFETYDICEDICFWKQADCLVGILGMVVPILSKVNSIAKCTIACDLATREECIETCAKEALGEVVPGLSHVLTVSGCFDAFVACLKASLDSSPSAETIQASRAAGSPRGDSVFARGEDDFGTAVEYLQEHIRRLSDIAEPMLEIFGDASWFNGQIDGSEMSLFDNWVGAFSEAITGDSENGSRVSSAEEVGLVAMPLPSHISTNDAIKMLERWNRSMDYWDHGIFTVSDVPPGQSTDFIDLDRMVQKAAPANDAAEENMAEGFFYLFDGIEYALQNVYRKMETTAGICAQVRIRIDQEAVISRDAFEATLEISNNGDTEPLERISVTLDIRDELGNSSGDLFGVYPPELTGIVDVGGDGVLPAGETARAQWIIVPTSLAAPAESARYYVGGELSYLVGGELVTIPLFPAPITVLPSPNLQVKYFLEREVYSDDPFTDDVIEPAIPFSLGLMMSNTGAGVANSVWVTSSQPEIVENEKGLLIDFRIIGTYVGAHKISPTMSVDLGSIEPSQTVVAQWLMTASLQGELVGYEAAFEHIDGLGDQRLSLVESVGIHGTEHVVRAEYPEDDDLADFLADDIPDVDALPDTLHLSDGSVVPVTCILDGVVDGLATAGDLEVELTVHDMPEGWTYIRVDDPGDNRYQLAAVTRSDGRPICVSENAWTTHKIVREVGKHPYDDNRLHLFDYGGTGMYTLTYAALDAGCPTIWGVWADDVTEGGGKTHTINVTFVDDVALHVHSFNSRDVRVTGPHGFEQFAKLVHVDALSDGTPRTVTYRIDAPDGVWGESASGLYSIWLEPGQVCDTSGNFVAGGLIGTFTVDVGPQESPCDLTGDGEVDCADLDRLAARWLWTGDPGSRPEDIVGDGSIDFLDYARLAEAWTASSRQPH